MEVSIRARAPGKIILAGEHAVVHGSTAVAASIDLYTHASFVPQSDTATADPPSIIPPENCVGGSSVILELKDLGLIFSWATQRLNDVLPGLGNPTPMSPHSCSTESLKLIGSLVEEQNLPEANIWLLSGISAFLYLYISIVGYKPGKMVISSNLPLGSGLGSSAAFCVSISAVLLALSGAVTFDVNQKGWLKLSEIALSLVNRWAFEGERVIHGKPSGIDNTVSTFGNMIMFKSGELTPIKSSAPLRMLITNTKVGRNTKALVAGVSERAARHPDAMAAVFTAVDHISKELSVIITSPALDEISLIQKEEKLEELMEMNQGLLQCMGVSHASIETVLRTTLKYKLTSKLTGAGGGGCVLTLLPTLLSSTIVDKVIGELEACGFQCILTKVGGKGLEICYDGST